MARKPATPAAPAPVFSLAYTAATMSKVKDVASIEINADSVKVDGVTYAARTVIVACQDGEAFLLRPRVVTLDMEPGSAVYMPGGVYAAENDDTWAFVGSAYPLICENVPEAESEGDDSDDGQAEEEPEESEEEEEEETPAPKRRTRR